MDIQCIHNNRTRFPDGFHCSDCSKFFSKDSSVYRKEELLVLLWMALNNVHVRIARASNAPSSDALIMREKIGIEGNHENYEELIAEAESILAKYGADARSAIVVVSI